MQEWLCVNPEEELSRLLQEEQYQGKFFLIKTAKKVWRCDWAAEMTSDWMSKQQNGWMTEWLSEWWVNERDDGGMRHILELRVLPCLKIFLISPHSIIPSFHHHYLMTKLLGMMCKWLEWFVNDISLLWLSFFAI